MSFRNILPNGSNHLIAFDTETSLVRSTPR